MKVFKFGGASVKNAEAIKNLYELVNLEQNDLVVIVSAIGKTTNKLEKLHILAHQKESFEVDFEHIKSQHYQIIEDLVGFVPDSVQKLFHDLENSLKECFRYGKDFTYAQIVSYGELISTQLISEFFNYKNKKHLWFDARKCIRTDNNWLEGNVNWNFTKTFINQFARPSVEEYNLIITQGFIGADSDGHTTTLGREGSDYSAAIFASCLKAESVTVWKDVEGVLTGDPKMFADVVKFDELSYRETVEMAFYGASVIHPKTIKPLSEENIPLYVRSFIHPKNSGTVITAEVHHKPIPSFMMKQNQCLVTFANRNLDFTDDQNFGEVLTFLSSKFIKINLIQSSATSFSVCIEYSADKISTILKQFSEAFSILYNNDLTLFTIKNYDENALKKLDLSNMKIYMEQRTRNNVRMLYKTIK